MVKELFPILFVVTSTRTVSGNVTGRRYSIAMRAEDGPDALGPHAASRKPSRVK